MVKGNHNFNDKNVFLNVLEHGSKTMSHLSFYEINTKVLIFDLKKNTLFEVFNKTWAIQMRNCHFKNVLESCIPFWVVL